MKHKLLLMTIICFVAFFAAVGTARAQTTAFTYQGRLADASTVANGSFDFEFAVFDAAGTQQGSTLTLTGINITAGLFTVQLDFGSMPFAAGTERFLEVRVKKPTEATFTILTPRQRVAGVPFGTRALSAATADAATMASTATNANQLGGVTAANYLQNNGDGSGLTNLNTANLSGVVEISKGGTGSTTQNFVDLTAAQTVAGAKTFSSAVNTSAQYNIGGNRVLSNPGQDNLFAGLNTGIANTSFSNSFFGSNAGRSNATGSSNSFFGANAGFSNTAGSNSFFGSSAGRVNTTGSSNSFFGNLAGFDNTTGFSNAFFGSSAGGNNTTGANNSALGSSAGNTNTTGSGNVFIGFGAGRNSSTGNNNIFIGNTSGTVNAATQVTNSIGIGNNVSVSASNTIVLGTNLQEVKIPGLLDTSGGLRTYGVPFAAVVAQNLVFRRLGVDIAAGFSPVCFRLTSFGGDGGNGLTSCINSFASSENKTDIQPFTGGLDIVKRLKPVSFKWKTDEISGIGLNAEDVAAIAPQIVTRSEQGEIQEVNENSLIVILINAVKEQQKQIETQQRQIDALRKMICPSNPNAAVCQEEQK